jgi:MFS family permease
MQAVLRSAFPLPRPFSFPNAQQISLPAVFALIGLLFGTWASRIPALQEGLHISHSALSLVLLCGGLGGMLSHPIASRMMIQFGGKKTLFYAGLALCLVLPAIGLAPNVPLLMLAVLMLGVAGGSFGIGANSVAAKYEQASGQARMSMFHACGCAGSLAGAVLGSFAAGMEMRPAAHFVRVAISIAVLLWVSYQHLDAPNDGEVIEKKKFALPSGPLALLGALAFCAAMSENSVADWGGVFLKEHFGVTAGFAPLALSVFTVMMLLARLFGDRLKIKHGAGRLITVGGGISALGLLFAALAPNAYFALAGFACSGMGLALVFPFLLSAAGKEGPLAIAGVATMASMGGLMGPPVVGVIADWMGMQMTISFIGTLSVVISVVATRSSLLK